MSKKTFLLLTILAAILIGWPDLNFYQTLSAGDHGRDLYAYEQVYQGKAIYKDIWWVYGPLMPYYYGLFYFLFGFKISSILIAKFLLNILCGVAFYLSASVVMPYFWAFLAACFFLHSQQDFFFTFNHIGGILAELMVLWMILRYLYEKNIKFAFGALAGCFVLGLIKINFGVTMLIGALASVALIDKSFGQKIIRTENKKFYISGVLGVPLVWLMIYGIFLNGLSMNEIRQCMPYFGDDQPHHRTPFETIPYYIQQHLLTIYHHTLNLQKYLGGLFLGQAPLFNPVFLLMISIVLLTFLTNPIIHLSTIATLILAFSKRIVKQREFWLTLSIIWLFFILNFHEFLVSGVWYRTFWSQPFHLFFSFFMIATAMAYSPRWLRITIASIWIAFITLLSVVSIISTQKANTPERYLNTSRGQIYVGNQPDWVDTVNTVSAFLNQTLKPGELFLALPYDCLYYYMSGKESPTRQLIFFDHIKIQPEQEVSIIKELESKKVNYVLISNRMISSEIGLGILGKTYCPLIYRYVMENFAPLYRYGGNWQEEPGWGHNHGVMIFKRK